MKTCALILLLLLPLTSAFAENLNPQSNTPGWSCGFEEMTTLPNGWSYEGLISITAENTFKGSNALVLNRAAANREKPCSATTAAFPITAGSWEFSCATASDLESPDSSYDGVITVEILNAKGKIIDQIVIADVYGKRPWQLTRQRLSIPARAVSARFVIQLNKTIGTFRVDELAAKPVADEDKVAAINRIVFSSSQLGNMFRLEDPRILTVTVESIRELTDTERVLTWTVRDYWSAEQAPPETVTVTANGKNKDRFSYTGSIDLAKMPLEVGRYYEIHGQIPLTDSDPYRNWSSFAILPVAPAKAYKPTQIPFGAGAWDGRIAVCTQLSDRLGCRIGNRPQAALCAQLDMGIMSGTPGVYEIEHHTRDYEKMTEATQREAIRKWLAENGKQPPSPVVMVLGNEPGNSGERLKEAVRCYKIAYDEIKKVAPETIVIATSVSADEEYFKLGFQDACDAFNYHVYESPQGLRAGMEAYGALMKKYHCVKPVWVTETGLNAQGMTRQYVASDMARKVATFFAAGGAWMSWFDTVYPDTDAKGVGSSGDAFNMFDGRYNINSPRLDAIMYYNLINGILIKKFANERTWKDGINGCLFRDGDGWCFAILWKDKGRSDVVLPLVGVKDVSCVHIDGRRTMLDANGTGIGLSIGEDPLLLSYKGPATLPESLAEPEIRISSAPERLIRGMPATITLGTKADPKLVSLLTPPGWKVERNPSNPLSFTIASPEASMAKAGDLLVHLANARGRVIAELATRPTIAGRLGVAIWPKPAATLDGQPSVQIEINNLAAQPQTVNWTFSLTGEQLMTHGGYFSPLQPTNAFLADAGSGKATVAANSLQMVTIPLSGIDPLKLYHAKASITDADGGTITCARALGGFASVPRAAAVKLDGVLDEPAWKRATPCLLNKASQYFAFGEGKAWKGPDDLSATQRCLWDNKYLYIGVEVTDDVFRNVGADGDLYAGDGVQFLFDPKRDQEEKPGKYDAVFAVGTKGPEAWYSLTGSSSVPSGIQKDVIVTMKRGANGNATYEIAIPWAKLAPFEPHVGADLGAAMIVNEDDGTGRCGYIGWFGDVSNKLIDIVGDLILGE
ncbi:MAG: sugar-binding protein [Methylacidiphilales bacterium]|nr:sugar-binding protein [Candidatus Methylacidiphilales bacterium]